MGHPRAAAPADPRGRTPTRRGAARWGRRALVSLGVAVLGGVAIAAVVLAISEGAAGFSAVRLSVGATALAFAAACFSAWAGWRSAQAGEDSAAASHSAANTAERAHRQELYELARALHADLTTGAVAEARERLGGLIRDEPARPPGLGDVDPEGNHARMLRADWFVLLWCFERIRAGRRVLAIAEGHDLDQPTPGDTGGALELLDDSVRAQLSFLNRDATAIRERLEGLLVEPVEDDESEQAFIALVESVPHVVSPPNSQVSRGQLIAAPATDRAAGEPLVEMRPRPACGRWADPISTVNPYALAAMVELDPPKVVRRLSTEQLVSALGTHRGMSDGSGWRQKCDIAHAQALDSAVDPLGQDALARHLEAWPYGAEPV